MSAIHRITGVTERGRAILDTLQSFMRPVSPGELATACGFKSTSALRFHLAPLVAAKRIVETGKSNALRLSLPGMTTMTSAAPKSAPVTVAPARPVPPAPREAEDLETVWDGSKGSPSLTGGADGLGSSLSGVSYEVGRRGR